MIKNNDEQLEMFDKYSSTRSNYSADNQNKIKLLHSEFDKRKFLIFLIIFIVVNLLSFSVGVERGLRLAKNRKAPSDALDKKNNVLSITPELKENKVVNKIKKQDAQLKKEEEKAGYSVQVASYRTMLKANQEVARLAKKGYSSFVLQKGKFVVVCVGKFKEKSDANVSLNKLKETYSDSIIRRL